MSREGQLEREAREKAKKGGPKGRQEGAAREGGTIGRTEGQRGKREKLPYNYPSSPE